MTDGNEDATDEIAHEVADWWNALTGNKSSPYDRLRQDLTEVLESKGAITQENIVTEDTGQSVTGPGGGDHLVWANAVSAREIRETLVEQYGYDSWDLIPEDADPEKYVPEARRLDIHDIIKTATTLESVGLFSVSHGDETRAWFTLLKQ